MRIQLEEEGIPPKWGRRKRRTNRKKRERERREGEKGALRGDFTYGNRGAETERREWGSWETKKLKEQRDGRVDRTEPIVNLQGGRPLRRCETDDFPSVGPLREDLFGNGNEYKDITAQTNTVGTSPNVPKTLLI